MTRNVFLCTATALLALAVACSKTSPNPASPTSTTAGSTGSATDGFLLKAGTPGIVSPTGGITVQDPITLTASTTKGTYADAQLSYRFQVRSGSTVVAETVVGPILSGSTVSFSPTGLVFNTTYTWRVQATYQGNNAPWSADGTFKTIGKFADGRQIFDPMLDGTTAGVQRGGRFIVGQGWQSQSLVDGIDYPIQTCSNCRFEFDVVGFGKEEGAPFGLDVKWFAMGDGTTFPSFGAFRDHPWKMHLEQRADDATGVKLIWRNGSAGDGDPGDHTFKGDGGVTWSSTHQPPYHFVIDWTEGGFAVTVDGNNMVHDGFSRPYAPPSHTMTLGCWPRGETMIGAIFSNVRLTRR
jgi:hypothetical protein